MREQMARLDETCARLGRDPGSLRRLVLAGLSLDGGLSSVEAFLHTTSTYAAAGVTDFVVHWPRDGDPYAGDLRVFEHVISAIR